MVLTLIGALMINVSKIAENIPPVSPQFGEMFTLSDTEELQGDFKQYSPLDLVQFSDRWIKIDVPLGTLVKSNYDGSHFKLVPTKDNNKKWLAIKS